MYIPVERLNSQHNFEQASQWVLEQGYPGEVVTKIVDLHRTMNGYQWQMIQDPNAHKRFTYHPVYSEDHDKALLAGMLNTDTTCVYPFYQDPSQIIPAWLGKNSQTRYPIQPSRFIDILNGTPTMPSVIVMNRSGEKRQGIIDWHTFDAKQKEPLPAFYEKQYLEGKRNDKRADFIYEIGEPKPRRATPLYNEPITYVGVIKDVWDRVYDLFHTLRETPQINQALLEAEQRLNAIQEIASSPEAAYAKEILEYVRDLTISLQNKSNLRMASNASHFDSDRHLYAYNIFGFTAKSYNRFVKKIKDMPESTDKLHLGSSKQLDFPATDPQAIEAKELYMDIFSIINRRKPNPDNNFLKALNADEFEDISFVIEPQNSQSFYLWWKQKLKK